MSKVSRRQTLGLGLGAGVSVTMLAGGQDEALAAPAGVTFTLLLVNDIYKAGDTKGRGGFPKLAAVVKAERARGVPMLFCHAGDSFSPSLISGFDQGEHIVRLTNMIKPDVFVPGNHEFDFGTEIYFKRMGEANYPFFGANMRQADGTPMPGMNDHRIYRSRPRQGRGCRHRARRDAADVAAGYARLPSRARHHRAPRPRRCARRAPTFIVCVAHTDREMDYAIVRSRAGRRAADRSRPRPRHRL